MDGLVKEIEEAIRSYEDYAKFLRKLSEISWKKLVVNSEVVRRPLRRWILGCWFEAQHFKVLTKIYGMKLGVDFELGGPNAQMPDILFADGKDIELKCLWKTRYIVRRWVEENIVKKKLRGRKLFVLIAGAEKLQDEAWKLLTKKGIEVIDEGFPDELNEARVADALEVVFDAR